MLAPHLGVLGAAIAVAIATLFWLVGCAVVLGCVSGLRTDALYLLGQLASPRSAPGLARTGLAGSAADQLDRAGLLQLLLGLLGGEKRGEEQPEDKGRNRQERDGGANFAEM